MGLAVALALAGAASCGGSPSATDPSGGYFAVTSVVSAHGAGAPVSDPESIRVGFSEDGHGATWTAGCNEYWADAVIKPSRIEIEPAGGTEVGCESKRGREGHWFLNFMSEDPEWRLDGSTLTLSTDRAVVELEPAERPEWGVSRRRMILVNRRV